MKAGLNKSKLIHQHFFWSNFVKLLKPGNKVAYAFLTQKIPDTRKT